MLYTFRVRNTELYRDLRYVSVCLRESRLIFAWHYWTHAKSAYQPLRDQLFWTASERKNKRGAGAFKT